MADIKRKRRTWCRHFTGIQNETCKEGIAYASVREAPTGGPYRFPCLFEGGHCDKASPFTAEEEAQRDREIAERLEKISKARAAIVARGDRSGEIPCPCCDGGRLRYSVAALNGHVHAVCSTPECVRWME